MLAAPDVSELLEALPVGISLIKSVTGFYANLNREYGGIGENKNPSEPLASLWLELNEKKPLTN